MLPSGQEDIGNPIKVQKFGCDLWCHWDWVEILLGKDIFTTPKIVTDEYTKLLNNGIKEIDSDCTIENGEKLFSIYGIKVKQVVDPITKSSHLSPNYPTKNGQIVILCYHWDKKGYIHFAVGDENKKLILDPITRGSNTIKYGHLHSVRVYEVYP